MLAARPRGPQQIRRIGSKPAALPARSGRRDDLARAALPYSDDACGPNCRPLGRAETDKAACLTGESSQEDDGPDWSRGWRQEEDWQLLTPMLTAPSVALLCSVCRCDPPECPQGAFRCRLSTPPRRAVQLATSLVRTPAPIHRKRFVPTIPQWHELERENRCNPRIAPELIVVGSLRGPGPLPGVRCADKASKGATGGVVKHGAKQNQYASWRPPLDPPQNSPINRNP